MTNKITTPAQLTEFVEEVKKLNEARTTPMIVCVEHGNNQKEKHANQKFIAAAPQMAEALIYACAEVERLREENIALRRKVKHQRKANRGMHKMQMISDKLARKEYDASREKSAGYDRNLSSMMDYIAYKTGMQRFEVTRDLWKYQRQTDQETDKTLQALQHSGEKDGI